MFVAIFLGALFLRLPVQLATIHWPLFLATFATGVVMLAMMGLILSVFSLLLPDNWWTLGEAVAGSLYLFSGAIFPSDVLPKVLRPIGFAMPATNWLELLQRSLVGSSSGILTFSRFGDRELLGIFVGMTLLLGGRVGCLPRM